MLYQKLKMKAAAGKDGITAKMMNREVFVELWWELFNWCWGRGIVPSMWKSSMVVPVPKTRSKEACRIEEFCGISVVSVVFDYPRKACEGSRRKAIIGGGAGAFKRGRGCRDQILT